MNPQMQPVPQMLPTDFDGTFRFTNWTDRDFTAKWGGVEYTFPALKSTPMVILNATPYEVQSIRKKFAKELAEREFFTSKEYSRLDAMNKSDTIRTFHASVSYAPQTLESYVQKCLEPLPVGQAEVKIIPKEEYKPKVMRRLKSKASGDNEAEEESLVGQGNVVA